MKKNCRNTNAKDACRDYFIDPLTRRSRFLKNNKIAVTHGGYSRKIDPSFINAALDNDLAFEVGILKGQLVNLATIGKSVISKLIDDGDELSALNLSLMCAERSAKLAPQIQKILESELVNFQLPNRDKDNARRRHLRKLKDNKCSALEVAYQYEVNDLGQLPQYVKTLLLEEIKKESVSVEEDIYTKEEIEARVESYWQSVEREKEQKEQRKHNIAQTKNKLNTVSCDTKHTKLNDNRKPI